MYRDILVTTDGSESASRATEHGLDLARTLDATVHALVVLPPGGSKRDRIRSDPAGEAEKILESFGSRADQVGVAVTTAVRSGDPCETIVDHARERSADLIVMGSTSESRLGRLFGKNTTQCVLEKGAVPVLSVDSTAEVDTGIPDDADHRFRCPECESSIHVTDETREALIERGCAVCGGTVTEDAFS